MSYVPPGRGAWLYQLGYRICVSGLGHSASKTDLQGAFGEYGHIIRMETPGGAKGIAYITFEDKRDAHDAVKYGDGQTIDGRVVHVTLADLKPPPSQPKAAEQQDLPRTNTSVREEQSGSARASDSKAQRHEGHRRGRSQSDSHRPAVQRGEQEERLSFPRPNDSKAQSHEGNNDSHRRASHRDGRKRSRSRSRSHGRTGRNPLGNAGRERQRGGAKSHMPPSSSPERSRGRTRR